MAKILISGRTNSGKTTLLKDLDNALIISTDNKRYPFKQAHINIYEINGMTNPKKNGYIDIVTQTIEKFNEKFKRIPETIAFDSVSTLFSLVEEYCSKNYNGFDMWKKVNEMIMEFCRYIEFIQEKLNCNIVLVSHATYDENVKAYTNIAAGKFEKKDGFLSQVDDAVFVEANKTGRTVYVNDPTMLSRTTLDAFRGVSKIDISKYSLKEHIDEINKHIKNSSEYEL